MNCEYLETDSFPYLKRKISNKNNRSLSPEETNMGECSISLANPRIRQHTVGEAVVFTVLCVAAMIAVPEFALSWNLTCKPSLVWSCWRSIRLSLRWTCKSSRPGKPTGRQHSLLAPPCQSAGKGASEGKVGREKKGVCLCSIWHRGMQAASGLGDQSATPFLDSLLRWPCVFPRSTTHQ